MIQNTLIYFLDKSLYFFNAVWHPPVKEAVDLRISPQHEECRVIGAYRLPEMHPSG